MSPNPNQFLRINNSIFHIKNPKLESVQKSFSASFPLFPTRRNIGKEYRKTTTELYNYIKIISYSFYLIFSLLPINARAKGGIGPDNAFYLVHDYQDDWQVFDNRYKAYVPYVGEQHKGYNSFSLFFDIENYKGYKVLYRSEKENYLFIDATLQKKLSVSEWVVLDIDSLQTVFGKTKLFLTIYGTNLNVGDITVEVGNKISKAQKAIQMNASLLTILPRDISPFQNFFIIGLILLTCFYAFLYNFQLKSFERIFSIRDLLTISKRDDSFVVNKPFDLGNLLFIVNLSLTISYIFMLIIHEKTNLFSASNILSEGETLGVLIVNFVEITIIIFAVLLMKYGILKVLSNLYRLDNVTNIHYFKIIQASSLFFLIVLIGLTFSTVSVPGILLNVETYLFIPISLFFIARLALLYFTINKMTTLKNLYLFSYLCIVELIPLIVGIRFAL